MEGGWSGNYYLLESLLGVMLALLSLLLVLMVGLSEITSNLKGLCKAVSTFSTSFFGAMNALFMFVVFELVTAPVLLMIKVYGSQPEKVGASYYAMLYTSTFSLPFLGVILSVESWPVWGYTSPLLLFYNLSLFLVKSPLFMMHHWLPRAHVEAPTSCSMVLAGLLLKVGVYGFLKVLSLYKTLLPLVTSLSAMGVAFGGFLASLSSESKVLTAYSSVTHINLGLYGVNVCSSSLLESSYVLCLGHGYCSTLLFYLAGSMYHNSGTRVMYYLLGVSAFYGLLFTVVVLTCLTNAGVPPTLPFWSELTTLSGLFVSSMGSFVFLTVYFMLSFYFSVYMFMHVSKSGPSFPMGSTSLVVFLVGLFFLLNPFSVLF